MSAEIKKEEQKIISEWIQRAVDDLESAEIILRESDNYDIVAYHAHQAIEKALKAGILKKGKTFKFVHDLIPLFESAREGKDDAMLDEIIIVDSLYPKLRYPFGDRISREQAENCLKTAKKLFLLLGTKGLREKRVGTG